MATRNSNQAVQPEGFMNKFSNLSVGKMLIGIAALIVGIPLIFGAVEVLDATSIMVIQSPWTGELTVFTEPGPHYQGWGTVTRYPRRVQYSFSASKDQGATGDQSIPTTFNDGGKGRVSGVISFEIPLKREPFIRLHKEYGSIQAIDQQLIRPMLEKVIFSAGATMSSIESSSERRPELAPTIDDQLENGPYLTTVATAVQTDPITKTQKAVRVVQVVVDQKTGKPTRASASTIKEYGIALAPVTVNDIYYEKSVQEQINERQKSTQAVQLSQAAAIKATQDAITTEQQGKANAAKAKWDQETLNAKDIALAEKNKQVAMLDAQAAEQVKRRLILEGEGEAQKKQLIMNADGALDKKLEAYVKTQAYWADAFKGYTGAMVPQIMMGGATSGVTGTDAVQNMATATSIKALRDLGIDLQAAGAAKTSKK